MQVKKRKSTRLAQRRRRARLIFIAILLFIFCCLFFFFAFLSHNKSFEVQDVKIVGTKTLSDKVIAAFLQTQLYDGKLHLFSNKNILLLQRKNLEKELLKQFPRIKTVHIPFRLSNVLELTVIERKQAFTRCYDTEFLNCKMTDEDGFSFATGYPSDMYVTLIGEEKYFEEIKTIVKLIGALTNLKIKTVDVSENDAKIYLNRGFFVKMALDKNLNLQVKNLNTVLKSKQLRGAVENLQYIDLRFGSRVYYKTNE